LDRVVWLAVMDSKSGSGLVLLLALALALVLSPAGIAAVADAAPGANDQIKLARFWVVLVLNELFFVLLSSIR
jgi:hypothetical protein